MIAVIAPGPAGLASPPGHVSPASSSEGSPGDTFAAVVAALMATAQPPPVEAQKLDGRAHPADVVAEPGDGDAAPAHELALLASILAAMRQRGDPGTPGAEAGSPDRTTEANFDPDHAQLPALAALLAGLAGAADSELGDVDGGSGGDPGSLGRLLADLAAVEQSQVARATERVAGRLGTAGDPGIAPLDLVRTQLAASGGRGDGADAAALLNDEPADGDDLLALLGRIAGGGPGDQPAMEGQPGGRTDVPRDVAHLLASLTRSQEGPAETGAAEVDADILQQVMAALEADAAGRGEPVDVDLPDPLLTVMPPSTSAATVRAEGAQQAGAARVTDPALLASQFAETVESAVIRGNSEVRLVLNPPDLGHLDISVVETEQGLRIRLEASQGAARDLMERQIPALQQALEARDLRVERIQVSQAAPAAAEDSTDGRHATGDQQTGDQGDGGEAEWSPLASLGLADEPGGTNGTSGDGPSAATSPRGVVDADGRVDVLA